MDIKSVRNKLSQALAAPEDDAKYQVFVNAYVMLLDEMKINNDTACIAIEGVTIDKGVNFLDTFARLEKKEVQDAWKVIRGCEAYKNNVEYNALKLMSSCVASALGGDLNAASILGCILTALVDSAYQQKQEQVQPEVYEILKEYILEALTKDAKLPDWKRIKITPDNMLKFCRLMNAMLEHSEIKNQPGKYPALFELKKWISNGKVHAEEAIERKEREKNKPPKKSGELQKLVEHFKNLEEQLDKSIHEASKLALEQKRLKESLYVTEVEKKALEKRIKGLEQEIEELNSKVNKANQEVDERKRLNDAQIQLREDAQFSLLQDIARALKAEYGDYAETKDTPMSEMLGEIYREKLKKIFKILEQKGIKVEG